MRCRSALLVGLCLGLAYLAVSCTPSSPRAASEELAATSAYETLVAMGVIQPADGGPTATSTRQPELSQEDLPPSPTPTPSPTPSPTAEQQDCTDVVTFGDDLDITIPDDTEVAPGASLTKVWRINNSGTCTWNSSYALVFATGDQMGGPSVQAFPGSVAPDASVDLSIDLTAPTATGIYQGFWRIRSPHGSYVEGSSGNIVTLWVKIVVTDAAIGSHEATFLVVEPLSGYVLSNGTTGAPENVGDAPGGISMQGFMTWVISSIPAAAVIQEVEVDFSDFDTLGSPFANLQCLRAYKHDYGTLDSSDYISGPVTGALARWCDSTDLETPITSAGFKSALQEKVGNDRFQIRLQFSSVPTDGDDEADIVRFGSAVLRVKYTVP